MENPQKYRMGPRSKRGLRFLSDAERREYMRVYMQQRRMGETAAQREKRLLRDRIQRQIRRAQESAEKRAIRLRKDRLRHQIRRAQERHQVRYEIKINKQQLAAFKKNLKEMISHYKLKLELEMEIADNENVRRLVQFILEMKS